MEFNVQGKIHFHKRSCQAVSNNLSFYFTKYQVLGI